MEHRLDARIAELERELRTLRYERACDNRRASQKARWADPRERAKASAKMRSVLAQPDVRKRHLAAIHEPAVHAKMAEHCRRLSGDPIAKAKRLASLQATVAARNDGGAMTQRTKRAAATALAGVPRDPFEVALFGGGKR